MYIDLPMTYLSTKGWKDIYFENKRGNQIKQDDVVQRKIGLKGFKKDPEVG